MSECFGLVMAGGRGTRLWPQSSRKTPKQYLSLIEGKSFLQHTLERLKGVVDRERLFVITTDEQRHLAQEQWEKLVIEPVGRNTAPCIYLSLLELRDKGCREEDVIGFFPADHYIEPVEDFCKAIQEGIAKAWERQDHLVIVGITPRTAHSGYGYIQKGPESGVASFKEKPTVERAREYLASGQYLWNGGIFLGTWRAFYQHFSEFCPQYLEVSDPRDHYSELKAISFDHAILEHSKKLLLVEGEFGWSDVGEWRALEEILPAQQGNTVVGDTQITSVDSQGNIVSSDEDHVALVGVSDLVVVRHQGRLLVMDKNYPSGPQSLQQLLSAEDSLKHLL